MDDENTINTPNYKKYLSFKVGNETYGAPIQMVREIIHHSKITHVPDAPEVVKGVINLRGKIVPMISLRKKFSQIEIEFTNETCFIIFDVENVQVGAIVDAVCDVKEFNENEIEYSSQKKSWQASDYLIGLGKTKSHPIILIDLTKALSTESFEKIIKNGKINSDYSESAA